LGNYLAANLASELLPRFAPMWGKAEEDLQHPSFSFVPVLS